MKLDLTKHKFGRLTVVSKHGNDRHGKTLWKCKCKCGNMTIVPAGNLRKDNTKSCGCLGRTALGDRSRTHGMSKSAEYRSWCAMRNRCNNRSNQDYPDYGGRGISFAKRWQKFENFLADMGKRPSPQHTLDRRDTNGNYTKTNCRWVVQKTQCRNKRSNHVIEFRGNKKPISEWAEQFGLKPMTLRSRLVDYGWSVRDAMETPVLRKRDWSRSKSRRTAA